MLSDRRKRSVCNVYEDDLIVERLTGWELADPESAATAAEGATEPVAGGAPAPRTLTPEQERAVGRRAEPLLLAAGAGSGKTAVLVERFVRAVREDGIAPERILAITFTERAAGELSQRVRARLAQLGETAAARAIDGAFIGTFHGFCARILRTHARDAGLGEEQYEILDEGLAGRLRRQAFAEALKGFVADGRGEAVDLIAAYTADRARATVLGVYAELRSRGQRVPRLPPPRPGREPAGQAQLLRAAELDAAGAREARAVVDEAGARAIVLWDELLVRFGECYDTAKQARDGVDFDDLELLAGELLACDAHVRRAWAERFELLMVDELQDVNPRQLALVSALERENLFTVGDEWQSIYGFRHADVGLFRARDAHMAPLGQSLRLLHNFRGRPQLLAAVNAVFARRFGEAYIPLRAGRERERESSAHGEPRVELLLTDRRGWSGARGLPAAAGGPGSGAADWREAEALALARRVAELIHGGRVGAGQVAVLLRGMGDVDCYERALRGQGLHTVASAGSFWARQEVADLLAYLRALAEPGDELALYGVLSCPPVGLSSDDLALLASVARARECGVWEVVRHPDGPELAAGEQEGGAAYGPLPRGERERAAEYCAWLERERQLVGESTLAQLLERAIEHGGHAARLRADEDGERRLANVRKLVELAREWERSEGRDLRGFLDEAAFQQGMGGGFLASMETIAEPDASVDGEAPPDAVRLMSVHAAKGLEFDVVCVADLGRAPSMGVPDLLVGRGAASAGGDRIGVRLVELEDPEPRPALDYAELAGERREAQAEEEDRIVYVAMTRARERLLLSGAVDFAGWPRERPGAPPIAWLGPALAPELPTLCAEAVRPDLDGAVASADGVDIDSDPVPRTACPGAADRPVSDRPGGDRLAPALMVDGTDVPLRCRLNTPRMAGASA
jgi:ATP-dependent helicase/nuclease subunit A